jgi:hypothetical protein
VRVVERAELLGLDLKVGLAEATALDEALV